MHFDTVYVVAALATLAFAPACAVAQTPQSSIADIRIVHERDGLPNVFAKLKAGKPITVAYFGGSITAGAGASKPEENSYRGILGAWFRTAAGSAGATNVNAAIGGTGSDLGAFRLARDVLAHKPDLVFVEYAVNDGGTPDAMIDRAMEGIVRQIWRANPRTDICFVYTFVVGWLPDFQAGRLVRSVQRDEVVAEHYGIPSVNMAVPAAKRILAGGMTRDEFARDGVHPTDEGYRIYGSVLTAFLDLEREAAKPARRHPLPRPLRADSLERARMLGPGDLAPGGTAPAGWSIQDDAQTHSFPKLLAGAQPGAELTTRFRGGILAMFYVLGPDTGAFDYRIDGGEWQKMDPFDQWAKDYYRPHYRLLADGLATGEHRLSLRVRPDHHADSKGAVTRIGYLLVNE